ncbi:MAG: hypothetical protein V3T20_01570 [Gemmatimonadota bacterium]
MNDTGLSWLGSSFWDVAVDTAAIVIALGSIVVGVRSLADPVVAARPAITEVLADVRIPAATENGPGTPLVTAEDRRVTARDPISLMARNLEATIGRYRAVSSVHAQRRLACDQLRETYREVEAGWTQYSIARGRTFGGELPDHLLTWDEALYEAVRDVDRDFTASGCNRP